MSAGRLRSLVLFALTMLSAVLATFAVAAPVQAAQRPAVTKCSAKHMAILRADATKKANRISRTKRHSGARRRALRASLLAGALKRSGCRDTGPASASKTTGNAKRPSGTTPAIGTGPSAATAPTPAPQTPQSWWTGVQGGANDWDPAIGTVLGAKVVRVEFEIGTPVAAMRAHVADYADRGIRILPLAGFYERLPSAAEAQNLAAWTREFGPGGSFWASRPAQAHLAIRHIEFGNETSYNYMGTHLRGGEYAQRVRDAFTAIAAGGNPQVGLLVQADDGNQADKWVAQMYAAVPNLHEYADGWTVHPYGPRTKWQNRIDDVIGETARHGAPSSIPVDITEWGLATDDGRCLDDNYGWDACMTYQQAADTLTGSVEEMRARYGGRIRHFVMYSGRDQRWGGLTSNREHYFGLTTMDGQDKGAFTAAARALLAAG